MPLDSQRTTIADAGDRSGLGALLRDRQVVALDDLATCSRWGLSAERSAPAPKAGFIPSDASASGSRSTKSSGS